MTRVVHDRVLKDVNANISDHLRSHIHLTNCIHLKNHMHKRSPILADDKMLKRDLVVLQRSRSLRDPSMSPSSWQSHSVADLLSKRGEKDVIVGNGRQRCLSGLTPPSSSLPRTKVAPDDVRRSGDGAVAVSDRSRRSGVGHQRRNKREEVSVRNLATDLMHERHEPPQQGNSGTKEQKRVSRQDLLLKTISQQLNEVQVDCDDLASSHIYLHGKTNQNKLTGEEAEVNVHGHCSGLKQVKRRKFRSARRNRAAEASRDAVSQNEMSVASNSLNQHSAFPMYHMEENEEYNEQNVKRAPGSACGIPWNWSRIHHGGKTFLDIAGRSLSCGLSDSRLNRGRAGDHGRGVSELPVMSEQSSPFSKTEAEALPLIIEASGSKRNADNVAWVHDYSGELGIFADNLLKHEIDSDLASEARFNDHDKLRRHHKCRHRNLTQKCMPRTFRDLVGQNLVAQALSNTILKRKIGLLYVFYGPHGTGKTSCARIFARALNCQSVEHQKPCGFCSSCIAHDMGKRPNIREVGPVSNFGFESITNLLDDMILSRLPSQYRVLIFDDCDTLSPDCWSAILKVIDEAPRALVFILVCSNLDVLPHMIISRCQKFFFPKLKDKDIIYSLQRIATKENLEIDKDALKLIASRSDGSLRDAEMTLEQLSLLGQKISVPLVQELVGLISDEKLVDLLDLALSANTVNTVKNLREIMESGIEPLDLMSQLATVITDILAGTYDLTKERSRRKFFRRQALSKDDMEKLRQALKTLSEAEKQLRMSNDRLTWLTAAMLQLAPDQQYMLPGSSADISYNHSPLVLERADGRERPRKSNVEQEMPNADVRTENFQTGCSSDVLYSGKMKDSCTDKKGHAGMGMLPQQKSKVSADTNKLSAADMKRTSGSSSNKAYLEIDEIWFQVLEQIQINNVKEFMYQEGKLVSVSFGAVPAVQLMFSSHLTKSMAEKYRALILQAFSSVFGYPVRVEIRCDSRGGAEAVNMPLMLPAPQDSLSQMYANPVVVNTQKMPTAGSEDLGNKVTKDRDGLTVAQILQSHSFGSRRCEIGEILASCEENGNGSEVNNTGYDKKDPESDWMGKSASLQKKATMPSLAVRRKSGEKNQSQSLVKGKVSLAQVIHQMEGRKQRNGWSKRKAVTIAEKLEQENLRLEPRSRSLLCWKAPRVTRRKLSRLKMRKRKPQTLLKFIICGKCFSSKSRS